jgi:hypothetical protein
LRQPFLKLIKVSKTHVSQERYPTAYPMLMSALGTGSWLKAVCERVGRTVKNDHKQAVVVAGFYFRH